MPPVLQAITSVVRARYFLARLIERNRILCLFGIVVFALIHALIMTA